MSELSYSEVDIVRKGLRTMAIQDDASTGQVLSVGDDDFDPMFVNGGGGGGASIPDNFVFNDDGGFTITNVETGRTTTLRWFEDDGNPRWIFEVTGQGEEEDDVYAVQIDAFPKQNTDNDAYIKITRDGVSEANTLKVTGENGVEQEMPGQGGYSTPGTIEITTVQPSVAVVPNFGGNGDLEYTFLNATVTEFGDAWTVRYDASTPGQSLSVSEDVEARITTVVLATDGDSNNTSTGQNIYDLINGTGGLHVGAALAVDNDGTGAPPIAGVVQDTQLTSGSSAAPMIVFGPEGATFGGVAPMQVHGVDTPGQGSDVANADYADGAPRRNGALIHHVWYVYYNNPDLQTGVLLWDPTDESSSILANDTIHDLWFEVHGAFDGTASADVFGDPDVTTGMFVELGGVAVNLTEQDARLDSGGIVGQPAGIPPSGLLFANILNYAANPASVKRGLPGRLNSNQVKVVVTQDGTQGDASTAIDSTQGQLIVHAVTSRIPS